MSSPAQDQDKIDRLQKALGDEYIIQRKLGGGGMGDVYMATHKTLGGKWAIKLLADHLAEDKDLVTRFMTEARVEANLQHPNIVKVISAGQKERFHFLIMTFVDGEDLDKRIKREGAMDLQAAVGIGIQILRALECAHDNGVVHRDLKPANIRIDPYGTVVVMDFGIAKAKESLSNTSSKTVAGTQMGSGPWMSPEQCRGLTGNIDGRSDLYAFGVIMYEMIAGFNPFQADNFFATVERQITVIPHPLNEIRADVPQELSDFVMRLLEKDQADRYQSAGEARQILQELSGGPIDLRVAPEPVPGPHLVKLGMLSAVLSAIPGAEPGRDLTPTESHLLKIIDGTKNIRDLLQTSGLPEAEVSDAILALENTGVIYREIPMVPTEITPPRTTQRPLVVPPGITPSPATRRGAGLRAQPTVVKEEPKKKPPFALIGAAAAVVIAAVVGFMMYSGNGKSGGAATTVQVDSSPFAKVTIKDSKSGQEKATDETPFSVSLEPGTYDFVFVSSADGNQQHLVTKTIGAGPLTKVRLDFWDTRKTSALIEAYRK